jgi:2',3'-cyclic-nucleotide 2'-phosphodiesterase (5'-nucleotidase family)
MSKPIVSIDTLFSNQYTTGNLGNLTADYMLEFGNNYFKINPLQSKPNLNNIEQYCDFAVLNNGSLRNGLSPGNISLGDIFEAIPYENILVIIQLTGAQTDSLFQHIATKNGAYLANASCTINNNKAENIVINGSRFDSRKYYIVAINDYMLVGGDGFSICKQAKSIWNTGITVREALIQGLQNEYNSTKRINPRSQPRIKLMQPSNSRH